MLLPGSLSWFSIFKYRRCYLLENEFHGSPRSSNELRRLDHVTAHQVRSSGNGQWPPGGNSQHREGSLQWRHNEHNGVSNHQRLDSLLNHLFRRRSKKTSKPRDTGLCSGNSPVTSEFPSQRVSNAGIVSIWWRHHVINHIITFQFLNLSSTWELSVPSVTPKKAYFGSNGKYKTSGRIYQTRARAYVTTLTCGRWHKIWILRWRHLLKTSEKLRSQMQYVVHIM